MGWFWGSSSEGDNGGKPKDTLSNLDSSLRDFLAKESPVKYESSNPPAEPETKYHNPEPAASNTEDTKPIVPKESLFPDGRYAHLWKTYRPLAEVEAEGKSDQEKLMDALEGYKYRRAEIGRAALENCSNEQWIYLDCIENGGFKKRMTLCREDNQNLSRCYTMQSRFLKALGYLSTFDRPQEETEAIQMHADALYNKMIKQEKAIKAAKEQGLPVPEFPPILANTSPNLAEPKIGSYDPTKLAARVKKAAQERLKGLEGDERELEARAIAAELASATETAANLEIVRKQQAEEKRKRKEAGQLTLSDRISSLFGW